MAKTNNIYKILLHEKIEIFKYAFTNISKILFSVSGESSQTNKYYHAGEFGAYRQNICKSFLNFCLCNRFAIAAPGFVFCADEVSTETDIIIYDKINTQVLESEERQRFYPIESVVAIGEIKSTINSFEELKEALNKLSIKKALREKLFLDTIAKAYLPAFVNREDKKCGGAFCPSLNFQDQLVSFMICEELSFNLDNIQNRMDDIYTDPEYRNRHNIILSIKDGVMLYFINDQDKKILPYPQFRYDRKLMQLKNVFIKPSKINPNSHFETFASYISLGCSFVRVLHHEMSNHGIQARNIEGEKIYQDQK